MEALVSWAGRRVLVTGHTGFKGSWLALWLDAMGADVTGFALPAPTQPSLFETARIAERLRHIEGDVRDPAALAAAFAAARPEVVFHLAAQPLVRLSYDDPAGTYATNVMGTVNVLEAARAAPGVRAIVAVTSDKCYENREWIWPYRETDPMGGHDPYSSSKGCAELVVAAWRRSFFAGEGAPALASARAGNVIGGGDWAADRLVPDLVRAFAAGAAPLIRNPQAVRPWQHVLEALGGYILLAEHLLTGDRTFAEGWNFGPSDEDARPVAWIVERMRAAWGDAGAMVPDRGPRPHEAGLLRLDSAKARAALGWQPRLRLETALDWIVDWHKQVDAGADARAVTLAQIAAYRALAGGGSQENARAA
ncbi:CDP-glucose 4,6-dehydratase [Novosphingobium album (ex Liu et al. 2023)]|uniref:CDP-glucose 4,6-dehydratase n=1 Tax=Novosphingobium album (ex Liu et al. 2023) TaxID=3031130 RepID=A0ABT5WR74_9SPHN|nr:CDP-glucose 4,6-dehydratase [Novosphingobium album (ex Liu et al. 2023)]MDE8652349.1 CDP-glucose 4,6-dehydratase [Novosphingobium album (ex Liu et al. 2023)]